MAKNGNVSTDLVKAINREGTMAQRDPDDSQRAIIDRILAAETFEELFTQAGTLGADDILQRPFMLEHVTFNNSTFEEGSGIYAVLEVAFVDDGTSGVVTCGGKNVCTQLVKVAEFGEAPPFPLQFWKPEKPTARGFYPLWLEKAPTNA